MALYIHKIKLNWIESKIPHRYLADCNYDSRDFNTYKPFSEPDRPMKGGTVIMKKTIPIWTIMFHVTGLFWFAMTITGKHKRNTQSPHHRGQRFKHDLLGFFSCWKCIHFCVSHFLRRWRPLFAYIFIVLWISIVTLISIYVFIELMMNYYWKSCSLPLLPN